GEIIGARERRRTADRPADARRLDRGANPLIMGNGKGAALRCLGGACGPGCDSCGRPEPPRRDTDQALEATGELALVREADVGGDLRRGQVAAPLTGAAWPARRGAG